MARGSGIMTLNSFAASCNVTRGSGMMTLKSLGGRILDSDLVQKFLKDYTVLAKNGKNIAVLSCVVYSKNVLKLTVDNPCIILKNSMRSALIRRSSRDHSPSFFNITSYGNSLIERIILVNIF